MLTPGRSVEIATGDCELCGVPTYADDNYCGNCGIRLKSDGLGSPIAIPQTLVEDGEYDVDWDYYDQVDDENGEELSNEQWAACKEIESTSQNYFVTGVAGSGKSFLLQHLSRNLKRQHVIVAPTAVAALHSGGQTIHSLFQFPPDFLDPNEIDPNYLALKVKGILRKIDTLIIDEVSMVRADLFECMERVCRLAREDDIPFGGLQVVAFGDPFQLPPVVSDEALHDYFADNWDGAYFFNAPAWKEARFIPIELKRVFRQKDREFIELLNKIRVGIASAQDLRIINERVVTPDTLHEENTIVLAGNNSTVTEINALRLDVLPGRSIRYLASVEGRFEQATFPTEYELKLKPGAQVMFVANDHEKRWRNGTLGRVAKAEPDCVKVELPTGKEHEVHRYQWEKRKYRYDRLTRRVEPRTVARFSQYPVRLGWAITIHKSQGATLDSIVVNLTDGAFAHGQTYVALSRCRTLQGVHLAAKIYSDDVIVDPKVSRFMNEISKQGETRNLSS